MISDLPPISYSGNITAIYVNLTQIDIHSSAFGNNSGWRTLAKNVTLDLLSVLASAKLLGTTPLPPRKYFELRLLTSQVIITINGVNVTYRISSGNQTGIKVPMANGGLHIYGGQTATVQLSLSFDNNEISKHATMTLMPVAKASVT